MNKNLEKPYKPMMDFTISRFKSIRTSESRCDFARMISSLPFPCTRALSSAATTH